jgi:hypothetical protein
MQKTRQHKTKPSLEQTSTWIPPQNQTMTNNSALFQQVPRARRPERAAVVTRRHDGDAWEDASQMMLIDKAARQHYLVIGVFWSRIKPRRATHFLRPVA